MNKGTGLVQLNEECVILPEKVGEYIHNSISSYLVGKLWIDKSFNVGAFMSTIRGV